MKATIERSVIPVEPDFEPGTVYEYDTSDGDVFVVLVTGVGNTDYGCRLFSGVVIYAHATTGRFVGQTSQNFSCKSFKPFKGTLKIEVV